MTVYFYPHTYLRDRQLDTIRNWSSCEVLNPEIADNRSGAQVSQAQAASKGLGLSWQQKIPLLNLKLRPKGLPQDAVVYVWGGLMASGRFIVDMDNPWSLVGYNLRAMPVYKFFIRRILLSERCLEIRCMSEACRLSLKVLFGEKVYAKAKVHYPCIRQVIHHIPIAKTNACRFLFVGTQFEIKGGVALLKAFRHVYEQNQNARLDIVTHLPSDYRCLAEVCPGIRVHEAKFSRGEIHNQFMRQADVLILPTYVESFGMVALEALAHGLAIIATNVYALSEMVLEGKNGTLIEPPISVWDGVLPSRYYYDLAQIKQHIRQTDTALFEQALFQAMHDFSQDADWRYAARQASVSLMQARFQC